MFLKDYIQIGTFTYDGNGNPTGFQDSVNVQARIYDKKSISYDGDDARLDYDQQVVIYNFNPENKSAVKIKDVFYIIVDKRPFQAVLGQSRFQLSLKITNLKDV